MKRIFFLLGAVLFFLSGVYAQRQTYFLEDFNTGNGGSHAMSTYWDTDSSKSFLNYMYLGNSFDAGGEKPEALIGYYPALGMADVLNGTFRLISKPFETKAGNTYVTLKYYYTADKRSLKNNRSFSILARKGAGEWETFAVIDSLGTQIPASVLSARLPEAFEAATDVQIAIQLWSTKDGRNFAFAFDDVECFAIPSDWYAVETEVLSSRNMVGAMDTLDIKLKNVGNSISGGCTVSYSWDGGEAYTAVYDFPAMNVDETLAVRLMPQGWDETAYGKHLLDIWVSEIGGVAVSEAALMKRTYEFNNVSEADLFPKKILIEEFSSASCGPCASYNSDVFNPTFDTLGLDVTLIKYQMNWPGSGDKYYTKEGGARRNYYGVSGVPTMVVEGSQIQLIGNADQFLTYMRGRMASAGKTFFNIVFDTLEVDSATKRLTIACKVETKGMLENVKVQMAVVERETTGNVGSNGERSFHHVLMMMVPGIGSDGNTGATVSFEADTVYEFRYSTNLKFTKVEECDDLLVACFLQTEDGTVWQSAIQEVICTADGLANESARGYASLTIHPNPASEQVYLRDLSSAEVEVWDMAGRKRFALAGVNGDYVLDVRDYKPGFYIIQVIEDDKVSRARLCVVR